MVDKPSLIETAGELPVVLAPSILAGRNSNLEESLRIIEESGLSWVHLDIMDGHFVPNITFGPQTVQDLRETTDLFFDTHLMLNQPHRYVEVFAKAGANLISIHVEPSYPVKETLTQIREFGCQTGIAINPKTPPETLLPFLDQVDLVLVMTVQPGFGGQVFREESAQKISAIDAWRREQNLNFRIEVDGGINLDTARFCRAQGSDTFVAGTAFFRSENRTLFRKEIESL